jgi:uncharacterized membrane protein YvlD (DUF360 family)
LTGFIAKIILIPIALIVSDLLSTHINYTSYYQPIVTGIILAVIAHGMELLILRRGTAWVSTFSDFVLAFVVVYLSQFLFAGAYVTFWGALLAAVIIAVAEHFLHRYLISSHKTIKSH